MQKRLNADWFGHNKKLYTSQYITKVIFLLVASFLAPILLLCGFKGDWNECGTSDVFKKYISPNEPCIRYLANVVSYLFFIILLIVNVSLKSNADSPLETLSVLDWTILVFVFALVVQELRQAFGYIEKKSFVIYAQNWSNIVDCVLILSFALYYLLLFVGYYRLTEKFEVIRISFHVFGVCCLISCVRFVWYLQAHPLLGPIQVSFVEIFSVVVQFLVILGTLMVGFAICITSVYSAVLRKVLERLQTLLHPMLSQGKKNGFSSCFSFMNVSQDVVFVEDSILVSVWNDRSRKFRIRQRRRKSCRFEHSCYVVGPRRDHFAEHVDRFDKYCPSKSAGLLISA